MIFCTFSNLFYHLGRGFKKKISRTTVISVDIYLKLIWVRLLNRNPKTSICFLLSRISWVWSRQSLTVAKTLTRDLKLFQSILIFLFSGDR
jgi:hypothetical protein